MAGYAVNRGMLDQRMADTVIQMRNAFDNVEVITNWLADHPVIDNVDPLTVPVGPSEDGMQTVGFGYTADEAYLIRSLFEGLNAIDLNGLKTLGRKLTGLQ